MTRWRKALASTTLSVTLLAGLAFTLDSSAISSGENRTISLYQIHTGESLKVTYMVNEKYVPSAMKKINYLMRDWRRNQTITMDPKAIDLMWELHADLGSQAPIHIVSGYRSAKTNGFLKRVGRKVAKHSQHIQGKAIDIYFPDVPTIKMRNSALVRQVGGVGYYRSAGGPTGFLHIDTGNVRHWGPAISSRQMAQIFRDYRKTVGARLGKNGQTQFAAANPNAPTQQEKPTKVAAVEAAYEEGDEELASLTEEASKESKAEKPKLVEEVPEGIVKAYPVPKPRPKPIEVLMMAALSMKIEPASAPPPAIIKINPSPVKKSLGAVEAAGTMAELSSAGQVSNIGAKGSLAESLRDGTASEVPVIKTISASAGGEDLFWWPQQLIFNANTAVRQDGEPQPFKEAVSSFLPGNAQAAERTAMPELARAQAASVASGKGDMLFVNRRGKGSLLTPMSLSHEQDVGLLAEEQ